MMLSPAKTGQGHLTRSCWMTNVLFLSKIISFGLDLVIRQPRLVAPRHRGKALCIAGFVDRDDAILHVDLHRLPGRFGIEPRRILGRQEDAARRVVDRQQLLVELFVAALQTGVDRLRHVLALVRSQVGQVLLRRQEGERDVEDPRPQPLSHWAREAGRLPWSCPSRPGPRCRPCSGSTVAPSYRSRRPGYGRRRRGETSDSIAIGGGRVLPRRSLHRG
jgi:hypothetical protein